MGRIETVIQKYGLRDMCSVRGVRGQKMDEACIQKFIAADPSGSGKYFEWMIFQAGGGFERFYQSDHHQWECGQHGEQPVKLRLKEMYVTDAMAGHTDDDGKFVPPMSREEAEKRWHDEAEKRFHDQHVYGDEDYTLTGFGFYRHWPGHGERYEQVVEAVQRFHRYRDRLRDLGKSIDLSAAVYPNLQDLQEALADITYLEVKNSSDAEQVYKDSYLTVMCPFNFGASLRYGHQKWCTANESMFKAALTGQSPNRWKEYTTGAALYYLTFTQHDDRDNAMRFVKIAINAPLATNVTAWKFYDTLDDVHTSYEIEPLIREALGQKSAESFSTAMPCIAAYHKNFPSERLNPELSVVSGRHEPGKLHSEHTDA